MPTLTQLEYLIAVDRLRHFGKAAKACHVSQPTLSIQLHKLEEEYGITFFDRTKQPILPTKEGAAMIDQAKAVLREAGKLDYLGKNRSNKPMGEFKLALIPTIAPYLLPHFLGSFAKNYPEVTLLVEEMTTENIIASLESDRIDAGILATPLERPSLIETPLYYEPFWVFANTQHPLSQLDTIDERRLDSKDIWLLTEGHCLRTQILRICSLRGKSGVFPNIRLESGSLETVVRLVEEGHGYTILPQLAIDRARTSRKGKLRPFDKPFPSREVSLVCRRTQYKQAILDALANEVKKNLPEEIQREKSKSIEIIRLS